jgi:hypothetical protein
MVVVGGGDWLLVSETLGDVTDRLSLLDVPGVKRLELTLD